MVHPFKRDSIRFFEQAAPCYRTNGYTWIRRFLLLRKSNRQQPGTTRVGRALSTSMGDNSLKPSNDRGELSR